MTEARECCFVGAAGGVRGAGTAENAVRVQAGAAGRGRRNARAALRVGMVLDPHTTHSLATAAGDSAAWISGASEQYLNALYANAHSLSMLLADAAGGADAAAKTGVWDKFVRLVESAIVGIHGGLESAGIRSNTWGFAIIGFTVLVKALTLPLNYKQMESTVKMQALQPRMKQIQTQYRDNPQVMNQMIAEMYQTEKINPLAGCLPVFAQLPIWIALYRSVLNLAEEDLLNESFLWLPSLQGPVASSAEGLKWLFPFVNGAPPIGWHDAVCYLVLPVLLVVSQIWSQRILTPPSDDPQMQQTQKILAFLPFLVGWFSLNVPSGLGVYWVVNNLLSTGQTVAIRKALNADEMTAAGKAAAAAAEAKANPPDPKSRLQQSEGFKGSAAPPSSGASKKKKNRR